MTVDGVGARNCCHCVLEGAVVVETYVVVRSAVVGGSVVDGGSTGVVPVKPTGSGERVVR